MKNIERIYRTSTSDNVVALAKTNLIFTFFPFFKAKKVDLLLNI